MNISIESLTCCINYAQTNCDRGVPLRQYFGMDVEKDDGDNRLFRYTYGVGSGLSTVGGDVETVTTKPLTATMKLICKQLETMNVIQELNSNRTTQKIRFNQVTVL